MPKPIEPVPNNAQCERVLASKDVGVLVMSEGGVPYAVPMNHAFVEGQLLFHCATTGRKLDAIRANPRVCYVVERSLGEVEPRACHPDWESVIVYGAARVVEDPEELRRVFTLFGRHYDPGFTFKESSLDNTRAIVLDVESMTARHEVGERVEYWSWAPTK